MKTIVFSSKKRIVKSTIFNCLINLFTTLSFLSDNFHSLQKATRSLSVSLPLNKNEMYTSQKRNVHLIINQRQATSLYILVTCSILPLFLLPVAENALILFISGIGSNPDFKISGLGNIFHLQIIHGYRFRCNSKTDFLCLSFSKENFFISS